MQHTPGPWTLQRKATNHQHLLGPGPGLIADIHRDEDAVLIAAAPDLRDALMAVLPFISAPVGFAEQAKDALTKAGAFK